MAHLLSLHFCLSVKTRDAGGPRPQRFSRTTCKLNASLSIPKNGHRCRWRYHSLEENVRLAKLALRPGAGNLVNGILRKLLLLKENDSLPLPIVEGDDRTQARALATIHSHPVWMVRRWTKYIGQEDTVKLLVWNNSDPSFSLRANCGKGVARAELVKQLNLLKKQGLCAVQDESAGMVVSVVDPQPNETIIDCCAAPGGKTLYMASLMKNKGKVYAIDVNKGRLRILKETAKVHQVDRMITTVAADLREFSEETKEKYDKVLLDVPCSGLGVLSKRADLRWNRRLEDLEELKSLQDELLNAASVLVRPGGVLVYSTCSIDPEENEERVEAFLLRHPEFRIDPVDRWVPACFVMNRGYFSSHPVKHSLDGAFAARLVRTSKSLATTVSVTQKEMKHTGRGLVH
ncbi:Probable ribosomal RNA small subunit methyltransferase B [Linum perenne]